MSVRVLTREEFRNLRFCPCRNPNDLKDLEFIDYQGLLIGPGWSSDSDGNISPDQFGENQINFDVSDETQLALDSAIVCDSHSGNYSGQWESTEFAFFDSGNFPAERITGSLDFTSHNQGVEPEDIKNLSGLILKRSFEILEPSSLIYKNWGEEIITRNIDYSERIEIWKDFNIGGGFERYKDSDITETITTKPDGTYQLRKKGYKIIIVSGERRKMNVDEVEPFFMNVDFGSFTGASVNNLIETRKPARRDRKNYNIDSETFSIDYMDHRLTSNYSLDISRDLGNGGSFSRSENWTVSSLKSSPILIQWYVKLHDQDTLKNHPGEPRPVELELFYADLYGTGEFTLSHGQSTSGKIYNLDTLELQEAFDLIYLENNRGIISVLNREPSTKNNTILTRSYGYSYRKFSSELDFIAGRVATMFTEDWIALSEFIDYSPLLEESNETPFNDDFNSGINRTYISPVYKVEPLVKVRNNFARLHEWGDERLEGMVF